MPFPDFDGQFLPPGPYAGPVEVLDDDGSSGAVDTHAGWATTLDEVHEHLVVRFRDTVTRQALFHELTQLVALIKERVPCALFMLSGGFVTAEDDPHDIHVGVVLLPSALDVLTQTDFWWFDRTLDDREHQFGNGTFEMSTQLAVIHAVGSTRYDETLRALGLIRYVCGVPLQDGVEAGYVQFALCDEGGEADHEIANLFANTAGNP